MGAEALRAAIAGARDAGRAAFIPYLTAGDPRLAELGRFAGALRAGGADILELGVPFSDPVADGPVNQRAAERALAAGTTLAGVLHAVRRLREAGERLPVALFTYFNPVLRMGPAQFARRAADAGVDGVLVVDLPPEEAGEHRAACAASGLGTIFLASPTTAPERLRRAAEASTGFLYYVSRLGVTGERAALPESLRAELKAARAASPAPLAVGFGLSTPEQAAALAAHADAVVVGSALVRVVAEQPPEEAARRLTELARAFVGALARKE